MIWLTAFSEPSVLIIIHIWCCPRAQTHSAGGWHSGTAAVTQVMTLTRRPQRRQKNRCRQFLLKCFIFNIIRWTFTCLDTFQQTASGIKTCLWHVCPLSILNFYFLLKKKTLLCTTEQWWWNIHHLLSAFFRLNITAVHSLIYTHHRCLLRWQ